MMCSALAVSHLFTENGRKALGVMKQKRQSGPRDTRKASQQRSIDRDKFLETYLMVAFENIAEDIDAFTNSKTQSLNYGLLARGLTDAGVKTPTGKGVWSDNSAKNYWIRFTELKGIVS